MIKIEEIKKLSKYVKNKKDSDIPVALIYSKAFMSFSLDINVALDFMQRKNPSDKTVRVLYILKTEVKDSKERMLIYKNATNADLTDISYFENEKEILLFPFSVYEINDVQKEDNYYVIYLNILGRYKEHLNFQFKRKSDLIFAINQSNYIRNLQKNGLLPIIKDLTTIVLHFMVMDQSANISIVCQTSDILSDIKKIVIDNIPSLRNKNIYFLCNGMIPNFNATLEQNGLKDDSYILIDEYVL